MAETQARMQQRYDTSANWTSADPVLLEGEIGIESDTRRFKIGDGVSLWSVLSYVIQPPGSIDACDDVDVSTYPPVDGSSLVYNGTQWIAGPTLGPKDLSTDDYFDQVALSVHFNGVDGGTVFTDSSNNNLPLTRLQGLITSTTSPKFGGASGYFRGTTSSTGFNDGLQIAPAYNGTFALGTQNFTIEVWVKLFASKTKHAIFTNWNGALDTGFLLELSSRRPNFLYQHTGSATSRSLLTSVTIPLDQWVHIAFVRSGNTFAAFMDGIWLQSWSYADNITTPTTSLGTLIGTNTTSATPNSGSFGDYNSGGGYMDDLRLTIGTARYTPGVNFTPPTLENPDSLTTNPKVNYLLGYHKDVDTTGVSDGQGLFWDSTSQAWLPSNYVAGKINNSAPPATATSTGIAGEIRYDVNYVYMCTATDTWVRTPLSSW